MRRWVLVLALVCVGRAAFAESPGAEALTRGIRAFEAQQYRAAQQAFDSALIHGGLGRAQTLTAYVDLGVTLVVLGKTRDAQRAFEQAALIDPQFTVPPNSGRQATQLANQARRRQDGPGQYHFDVGVPGETPAGAPLKVSIEMSDEQAELVPMIRIIASGPAGKPFVTVEPTASHITSVVPADATATGPITVRFELLDAHDNRLAIVEKQVEVAGAAPVVPPVVVKPPPDTGTPPPETGSGSGSGAGSGAGSGDEGGDDATEDGPWTIPHGSKQYQAVRAKHAPVIDGVLDDAVWKSAPEDNRFLSTKSKPYGKPATAPTTVQLAYDDTYLYVAFTCKYAKPQPPNDAYAGDEASVLSESENVSVIVDAVHGHTGAYQFAVSPAGVRADAELGNQGATQNLDWHGYWDVATAFTADGWTAEFAIPWGTMYMPAHDSPFDIGINFVRHEPTSGDTLLWALHPPATDLFDLNFFGHVEGLDRVSPDSRLFFQPYLAAAYDSSTTVAPPRLSDLTGTNAAGRLYGGAYLQFRPPGPIRVDATFNPDFSAVTPDAALANYDRFELEYPEVRAFFAEDNPRFQFGGSRYLFGDLGAQLFYSRTLGFITNVAGLTQVVPILWGVKSVLRAGGTEAAIMNVETIQPKAGVTFDDNATVARVTQTFSGQRLGAIVLASTGVDPTYSSAGVDGQFNLFDRHLVLSGFYDASDNAGTVSGAGEGTMSWKSQDVYAKGTLLDIGKGFQAPLGYFPITGVRAETVAAGYTPVVRSDLVQQVFIDTQISNVRDRDSDALVYRRSVISAGLQTIEGAIVSAQVQPATENVTTAFPIGNGRIMVPIGLYHPLGLQLDLTNPPNRTLVYGIHYQGGDLYDGTRRAPGVVLGLNLGRFSTRASYTLYILKFEDQKQSYDGQDVSLSATFAYTPLARTTLVLEADTVAARGTALLTSTLQFGHLSALTLTIRGTSGSTIDTSAVNWYDSRELSAILSFALGVSPF